MAYAQVSDVADELGRPIEPDGMESRQIGKWLERVERAIRLRIPLLDRWCTEDEEYRALVADVESAAVARKAMNPEGIRSIMMQIDDGNLQKTIDTSRSAGEVSILDGEWELLMRSAASDFGSVIADTDPVFVDLPHYPPVY